MYLVILTQISFTEFAIYMCHFLKLSILALKIKTSINCVFVICDIYNDTDIHDLTTISCY